MLLATFFVATFGYLLLGAPTAHAVDAAWSGDDVSYNGDTYTKVTDTSSLPSDVRAGSHIYQYVDDSATPNLAYFLYFATGVDDPKVAGEATYIRYTLNPPNSYSDPTASQTVVFTAPEDGEPTTEDSSFSSCTIAAIGWLACPLMNGIAEGMDFIYERIRGFLSVQPITTSVDNPIFRIWMYTRDLANIAFVFGFLVIIYSYLAGGGFNGYEIRKILPRLVVAAVLINASYIICAVAVDISNIAGFGVNQLFEGVRDNVLPGSERLEDVNWTSVTTWVLAGGIGSIAGVTLLNGAIAGAAGGLWFLLAPFLLGAALLVIVTFLILAARQAIIVIAIAIAPLAFAAYILPNTEKWFERWRSLFFTMLIMFPAFGAVFGGAQLAGEVIIRTANSIEQVILGLGVMVAPLAITPLLLKLGGGVLNRFGGIVNNPQKGLLDRYKNYNRDRLAEHQARNQAKNQEMWNNNQFRKGGNWMRRGARRQYAKQMGREEEKEANTAKAKALYQDDERGVQSLRSLRYTRENGKFGNIYSSSDEKYAKYRHSTADAIKRDADEIHKNTEARHNQHWNEQFDIQSGHFDQAKFDRRVQTLSYGDKAKLAEDRMTTAYTEMQAGFNPYNSALGTQGPATESLQLQIDSIADTARSISMEGLKKQSADVVIKQGNASRLKMHEDLRNYVGGIGGEDAAIRVFASAKSEVVKDYLDSVKAMGSVQEAYSVDELINVVHSGRRPDGKTATEAEIDSAIQQIVTVKGNNWSFQKLKDHIAKEGVDYRDGKYYEPGTDVEVSAEAAESRRTRQQIFVDAAKNSKLAIKNLSGTDRGNLENGTFSMSSEGPKGTIVRDMRDQKINANRLVSTDIDELMHMVQVLRDDDSRAAVTDESRAALRETIEFATTDPQTKAGIGIREQKMMGVISEYLKHGKSMTMDQKVAAENLTNTPINTDYDIDKFYGRSAKYGGTEPYGPNRNMTPVSDVDPEADD